MISSKRPQTGSIQELAQFWDTHDLTDFQEELEEVAAPVFERETTFALHLGRDEAEAVRRMAESRGVREVDLIHQWVLEKLSG